jgi:hypothetical protein
LASQVACVYSNNPLSSARESSCRAPWRRRLQPVDDGGVRRGGEVLQPHQRPLHSQDGKRSQDARLGGEVCLEGPRKAGASYIKETLDQCISSRLLAAPALSLSSDLTPPAKKRNAVAPTASSLSQRDRTATTSQYCRACAAAVFSPMASQCPVARRRRRSGTMR